MTAAPVLRPAPPSSTQVCLCLLYTSLLGYGACAINPYLAHETIGQLIDEGLLDKDYYAAVQDYDNAILNRCV